MKVKIEKYYETLEVIRYNGGWTKQITGIDKTRNNGYSLKGDFVKIHDGLNVIDVGLYLDCDIGGSRKNQSKEYNLFSINVEGVIKKLDLVGDHSDWALQLWDAIDSYFDAKKSENPLEKFSDAELLSEIKRRNLTINFNPGLGRGKGGNEKSKI